MLPWFDVDKDGLAALIQRRGAASAVVELVQNSLDTDANEVKVWLKATDGEPGCALLVVEDNDPNGFDDLAHAFTLFAPSNKKSNAEKRGRFNLGEKLVLALCEWAEITSTKGRVSFTAEGRSESRNKRRSGSKFAASIRLEHEDIAEVNDLLHRLLLPKGVTVSFNDEVLAVRQPETVWSDILPTEIAGEDGVLKPSRRKTKISIFVPQPGEQPHLYEMGIPVVELDGGFHVNIAQKVPLNFERNNVTPSYLRALHVSVVNHAAQYVTEEQAARGWVADALGSKSIKPEAVRIILKAKYGVEPEQLVRYDPSDPESRNEAASRGFTVVGGRAFTPEQWDSINRSKLLPKAGSVAPSRNAVLRTDTNEAGEETKVLDLADMTEDERNCVLYVTEFATVLYGRTVRVEVVKDSRKYAASWSGNRMRLNRTHLPKRWWTDEQAVDEIILHEVAHAYASDHLDHKYYEAAFRLGAKARKIDLRLVQYVPTTKVDAGTKLTVEVD